MGYQNKKSLFCSYKKNEYEREFKKMQIRSRHADGLIKKAVRKAAFYQNLGGK
jgi:lysozyme family protein